MNPFSLHMHFSHNTLLRLFALCCGCLGLQSQTQETVSQLNETRTLLEEWVRTETLISEEKSQWEVEKRILRDIAEVANRELQLLEIGIAGIQEKQTEGEQAKDLLLQRRKELDTLVQRLEHYLPVLEQQLLERVACFPQPLLDIIFLHVERIPKSNAAPGTELPNFVVRAQNIAVILREADNFNSRITLDKPILELSNSKPKVYNVIYFGLGAAYFVDETGTIGGYGIPAEGGWQWKVTEKIAPRIKEAIAIHNRQIPARFIQLPVQVEAPIRSAK